MYSGRRAAQPVALDHGAAGCVALTGYSSAAIFWWGLLLILLSLCAVGLHAGVGPESAVQYFHRTRHRIPGDILGCPVRPGAFWIGAVASGAAGGGARNQPARRDCTHDSPGHAGVYWVKTTFRTARGKGLSVSICAS